MPIFPMDSMDNGAKAVVGKFELGFSQASG